MSFLSLGQSLRIFRGARVGCRVGHMIKGIKDARVGVSTREPRQKVARYRSSISGQPLHPLATMSSSEENFDIDNISEGEDSDYQSEPAPKKKVSLAGLP